MKDDIDEEEVTASDFAVLARRLPTNLTQQELKQKLEKEYENAKVKIVYINYTYNIDEFLKCT